MFCCFSPVSRHMQRRATGSRERQIKIEHAMERLLSDWGGVSARSLRFRFTGPCPYHQQIGIERSRRMNIHASCFLVFQTPIHPKALTADSALSSVSLSRFTWLSCTAPMRSGADWLYYRVLPHMQKLSSLALVHVDVYISRPSHRPSTCTCRDDGTARG